ncbi:MAG: CPBP family intramembrane metalloprotease [Muribaculaceae bacterium]|nr:CPBP family intramembrane metalloprotease [Muribaculaceae bacterium]
MKRSDLVLSLSQRLLLLLFTFVFCYGITALAVGFMSKLLTDNIPATLRISAMLQDVFAFIVPAIATAMIVTRRPAELLCIPTRLSLKNIALIIAMLFVSIPLQENIIYWNYHITLPDCLEGFGRAARELEDASFRTMSLLLSNTSIGALVLNLLIIGLAAGFSEELLFRGCFQRLLTTGGVNRHVAIWIVAIVFSAMHFQFYGFVPRVLLGAYFGYLLIWTGSIWAPILAHTLNNMMFVIVAWKQVRDGGVITDEPTLYSWYAALGSGLLIYMVLFLLHKFRKA